MANRQEYWEKEFKLNDVMDSSIDSVMISKPEVGTFPCIPNTQQNTQRDASDSNNIIGDTANKASDGKLDNVQSGRQCTDLTAIKWGASMCLASLILVMAVPLIKRSMILYAQRKEGR
jgi:hypothetical protein